MKKPCRYDVMLPLAALAVIMTGVAWLLPHDRFWITDGGNKFILLQNILLHGSTAISYPAADIDPEGQFFPDGGFHFRRVGDQFQSFYPPYYPWLCAVAVKYAGTAAVFLLSLVSGLACVWLTLRIAKTMRLALPAPLLAAAAGLGTPFLFYSLVFWEHMFSIVFAAAAMWLVVKARFYSDDKPPVPLLLYYAAGGLLLAVSSLFREESYILLGAVGLALLCLRTPFRALATFGISWVLPLVPLWMYQYSTYGHILGSHARGYQALADKIHAPGMMDRIVLKMSNFYVFLFKFQAGAPPPEIYATILVLPAILLVAASLLLPDRKYKRVLTAILLAGCALSALLLEIKLLRNPDPIINTLFTQGLLTAVPLLLVPIAGARGLWREHPACRFILLTWLFFGLTVCLFLNQGELGLIWGPRHFLVLMPLLVPAAVYLLMRWYAARGRGWSEKVLFFSAAALFLTSMATQFHGVSTLYYKKKASAAIVATLKSMPEPVVVSDVFWLGEDCGAIFFEKKFMQVDSDKELEALLKRLEQKKVGSFILVLSANPMYRSLSNPAIGRLLSRVEPVAQQQISMPRAGFMTVIITTCRLKP